MSRFFIHRPIFAGVIALMIVIAGLIASFILPVQQYPEITPPTVTISTAYPGASAEIIARTVAAPIEEQLSGVEGMIYFSSSSSSAGTSEIAVSFEVGTDVDEAVFNVNNRVQSVLPRLPEEVRRNGVIVTKRAFDILVLVSMVSPGATRDMTYLSNYALINIVDELKRIPGVADTYIFGARDYSMRIWLQPDKMARLGVTPSDVAQAIRSQNSQYAGGKIGAEPAPQGQVLSFTINARKRLVEAEQFGNIVVRAGGPHGVLRIKDVARIELGAVSYSVSSRVNDDASVQVGVYLQTGGNALQVVDAVRKRMLELKERFPPGVDYRIPHDTTKSVRASIREVVKTIFEAALLVLLVVFLFLQSWRATLIPMIVVPVSLIGTFAGLLVLGFSINMLTLFAMVLAIGIVVDDAIVVLENVERLMRDQGMKPLEAALEAMREVTGAIVAIVLVLCAVFVPVAFLGGLTGQLYQQFAVTVAVAVVISGFTALTLTPALCALLLRPGQHESRRFRWFNVLFAKVTALFLAGVEWALRRRFLAWLGFGVLLVVIVLMQWRVPSGFVPLEDQGGLFAAVILPDGATLERTIATSNRLYRSIKNDPAIGPLVENVIQINGFDLIGGSSRPNSSTNFIGLVPWEKRDLHVRDVAADITQRKGLALSDGIAIAFIPPPIYGLGTSGGFEFYLQARSDDDPIKLQQVTQQFLGLLQQDPRLLSASTTYRATVPQFQADVEVEKSLALGVPVGEVFEAMQSTMGALYVNDFNLYGRTFRVQIEADAPYRSRPEDLGNVYVRSATTDAMIPLKTLLTVTNVVGPEQVPRYNGFIAAKGLGAGQPGVSSGDAIALVEQMAREQLPEGYTLEWTGQAYQEKRVSSASTLAFGLAILMVFLILAALYERWGLPLAVILAVPFAVFGAFGFILLRGLDNDIYFQIGLVVLIGLAAKNAILIVEFAHRGVELEGKDPVRAAIDAARQRFRPIVMTSLAFVLGVLPLALASGAGAAARQSMGTGVIGGMLVATFIAPIFVPLFFVALSRVRKKDGVG